MFQLNRNNTALARSLCAMYSLRKGRANSVASVAISTVRLITSNDCKACSILALLADSSGCPLCQHP